MCNALEKCAGVNPDMSEKHKEHQELPSRQTRENRDLNSFHTLPLRNKNSYTLVSIATGIVANEIINYDEAANHGLIAVHQIVGKEFAGI